MFKKIFGVGKKIGGNSTEKEKWRKRNTLIESKKTNKKWNSQY